MERDTETGRGEGDTPAKEGDRRAFYRHKTVVFSEIMRVRHRHRPRLIVPGFSYVTSTPYRDESPVHLASPQRSSLRSLHPCFVLLARRVSRPVIPLSSSVASSSFGGLPSRAPRDVLDHTTLRKVDQRSRLAVGGGTPYVLELDRSTPEGYERLKLLGACLTQQAAGSNQALRGTTLGVIVTAVRHFLH